MEIAYALIMYYKISNVTVEGGPMVYVAVFYDKEDCDSVGSGLVEDAVEKYGVGNTGSVYYECREIKGKRLS